MLKISFLGKTKVEYKDQNITELLGNKTIALICMLALNNKKYVSREKIIAYLWPDSNENAAKYNLRFNLWLIKKNIGIDEDGNYFLCVDKECCAINEKYRFSCDLLDIIQFKPKEDDSIEKLMAIRELFTGEFLEGCYFSNCEELNELILFERINLEKKKVAILKRLAELYENQKEYESCLEIIMQIQEVEPYDEEIALKIMDLYAVKGNNAKAINYYNIFSNILAGSLGISPSEALKKRCDELKSGSQNENKHNEHIAYNQSLKSVNRNHIDISLYGVKTIKFFGVSQVIEKVLDQIEIEDLLKLRERYIFDLWHIQRKIVTDISKDAELSHLNVPPSDCCIVNAFIMFIKIVSGKYSITIKIDDHEELDEFSYSTLRYVKQLNIAGVNIKK